MEARIAQAGRGPRIVIADEDPLVRMVLRTTLEREGFVVVAECATARGAVDETLACRADLLVLDWFLPDGDAVEVIRKVGAAEPHIPVVVLTASHDEKAPLRALLAGAAGFLTKDVAMSGFGRTLRAVLEGEAGISRRLGGMVLERLRAIPENRIGTRPVRSPLTAREWEVLDLLCESRSTEEIAATLVLSVETVRSHVKHILRKLGASSRAEVVAQAPQLRKPRPS
jgi:DNA-binding NarL/FixJ family response regulator